MRTAFLVCFLGMVLLYVLLWQYEMGQSTGGGIVTYRANGGQRVAIASGMKSPIWPGAADASHRDRIS